VHLVDLVDASGTTRLPVGLTLPFYHGPLANPKDDVLKDLRYAFTMTLSLKSKPVIGRWNRLDLMEYESVNLENGDKVPISFGKEKPFWFSRVRSYA
jgi:F-box protein 9